MENLLRDYENFEQTALDFQKVAQEGEDLADLARNFFALDCVAKHFVSQEAQQFIAERFSLEADETAQAQQATVSATKTGAEANNKTVKDPTTGAIQTKSGDQSKKGSSGTSASILNKGNGVMGKLRSHFGQAAQWFKNFYTQAASYGAKLATNLSEKANEVSRSNNNLSYKITGVCMSPQDVQITPILTQVQGARSKEDLGKVFDTMKGNLADKLVKEEQEVSKDNFVSLLNQYAEANKRLGTERKACSTFFESTANTAAKDKDTDTASLHQLQVSTSMNVANYMTRYLFSNSMKLLVIAAKNMHKNG